MMRPTRTALAVRMPLRNAMWCVGITSVDVVGYCVLVLRHMPNNAQLFAMTTVINLAMFGSMLVGGAQAWLALKEAARPQQSRALRRWQARRRRMAVRALQARRLVGQQGWQQLTD